MSWCYWEPTRGCDRVISFTFHPVQWHLLDCFVGGGGGHSPAVSLYFLGLGWGASGGGGQSKLRPASWGIAHQHQEWQLPSGAHSQSSGTRRLCAPTHSKEGQLPLRAGAVRQWTSLLMPPQLAQLFFISLNSWIISSVCAVIDSAKQMECVIIEPGLNPACPYCDLYKPFRIPEIWLSYMQYATQMPILNIGENYTCMWKYTFIHIYICSLNVFIN